ncbi:MAG: beta-ketoacyl-ACP synthase II [Dehalococcoidales bacterium]|nr:beta-ketoacyl-ACP synthase II [Dehalococcoidales bacterium]
MNYKRVVITGLGAITPIGLDIEEFWKGLIDGKNGVAPIASFDTSKYAVKLAAEVKGFQPEKYIPLKRVDRTARPTHFAIAAAKMAIESAGLDMTRERPERVGTVIATGGAPTLLIDQAHILINKGPNRIDPLLASKVGANMVGVQVGLEFGLRGPNSTVNSACASGSDSLGIALNHIRMGHADVMIAGGSDATIAPITVAATGIVGALTKNPDPATACRPFDLERNGFVFGEGAGMLVLESYEHAVSRGANILAELAGAGWSFDAYNDTAPYAETETVAMNMAIQDAGISQDEVDYINAHGTGTQLNDCTETKAVKMVFGKRAYQIPMSSNKSMIGHLATAAGSVEAVAAVLTILHCIIPPTINYRTPDPACDLDYVPNKARPQQVNVCLSNSFGLGGQNCCLIIKRMV